jgi:hypothetical protein
MRIDQLEVFEEWRPIVGYEGLYIPEQLGAFSMVNARKAGK